MQHKRDERRECLSRHVSDSPGTSNISHFLVMTSDSLLTPDRGFGARHNCGYHMTRYIVPADRDTEISDHADESRPRVNNRRNLRDYRIRSLNDATRGINP